MDESGVAAGRDAVKVADATPAKGSTSSGPKKRPPKKGAAKSIKKVDGAAAALKCTGEEHTRDPLLRAPRCAQGLEK